MLAGAEAVVESGGVLNKLGTFQMAIVANSFGKPVYIATESYKFARIFPLDQHDFPATEVCPCPLVAVVVVSRMRA